MESSDIAEQLKLQPAGTEPGFSSREGKNLVALSMGRLAMWLLRRVLRMLSPNCQPQEKVSPHFPSNKPWVIPVFVTNSSKVNFGPPSLLGSREIERGPPFSLSLDPPEGDARLGGPANSSSPITSPISSSSPAPNSVHTQPRPTSSSSSWDQNTLLSPPNTEAQHTNVLDHPNTTDTGISTSHDTGYSILPSNSYSYPVAIHPMTTR
ncbi:hypothetical protein CRG98_014905 [Punica granatum]|uniref:Uncharacterized protein n=1 Tax=Punica granatum TaxID=22663 RepID=A0A2I0K812_PUNGR|nr:hypothetical protein CRG98_014905 [Punica granatum]